MKVLVLSCWYLGWDAS